MVRISKKSVSEISIFELPRLEARVCACPSASACVCAPQVFTKFDSFSSDDTRARAVANIRRGPGRALAPHAVCCRRWGKGPGPAAPAGTAPAGSLGSAEDGVFAALGLRGSATCGVRALRTRLPRLLADRIRTHLPELRETVARRLHAARAELQALTPVEGPALLDHVKETLLGQPLVRLRQDLSKAAKDLEAELRQCLAVLKEEDVAKDFSLDYFDPPIFQVRPA